MISVSDNYAWVVHTLKDAISHVFEAIDFSHRPDDGIVDISSHSPRSLIGVEEGG